jgi:hypothetical protein
MTRKDSIMHDALTHSIRYLRHVSRARLDASCEALKGRIEKARHEGAVTDEQAAQLIHDVHNERARVIRPAMD